MTAENTETHCAPPAEGEDAYRSLAANLPCIVYRVFLRENGRMRFFNDVIESATGYRMDELMRGEVCSIDPLIVEEDRLRITSNVKRAVERTEPFNVEYRIRHKDGGIRYFSERGRPTLGSDGLPDCIDGTIFDITEQKLAEQKLKESERRYDELAAQNRTIAWEVNAHGLYTFASHVSEAVLGFRPDELEGKKFFYDLHPEKGRSAFKEEALAVFARKELFIGLEHPCVTRDGRIVWMLTNGIPILGADGDLLGYRGSDTDITERKLANQKLQESEKLFKRLFHNHTAIKLILDPDTGRIVDANQAAADFYGWPKARLCRMRIQDINTLSLEEITREIQRARLQRRAYFEFRHRRSDGSIRSVAVFSSTIAIGERDYLHSIIHDITDQKMAEEALHTNQKDLQALFNAIAESVYLLDRNGAVIAANDTFAKRLGRTVEECIGKSVYSLIPGPVAERRKAIAERVVNNGKQDSFEDERNGRWYYHSIFPVMDGQAAVARLAVFTMDITSRKQVADAQAFLLTCGSPATGEDFFVSLARHLSVTLGMECACIDHLESDGKTAETVAFYADGKFEHNVRYTLENTPCGEVIGKSECCYTKNVQQVFPKNLILRKLDAESYSGTTLRDSKGRPIGLIAVIGHHPMSDPERVGNVLKLVAPRAAGEMERRMIEEDRVRLQAKLSQSHKMEADRTHKLRFPAGAGYGEVG